tara:strand:+ start:602 stop:1075 length:474 start_codon:yes stop_codon:yes gene_type:complete
MRKLLEVSDRLLIPLDEELELLELYLNLEQFRLQGQFEYTIELEPTISSNGLKCPAMITQVFVENAIWHGIMPKTEPGSISIKVFAKQDQYTISIEDDGVGFDQQLLPQKDYASWGTSIIEDKIKLIRQSYDVRISLDIQSEIGRGTSILLTLPTKI